MKVCRAEEGNASVFMCTYHGWAYDTGGKLVDVPNLSDAYHNALDPSQWGLLPVAQVEDYRGLYFGNLDPTAPPLVEYLGDMTYFIDGWVDHAVGGIEVIPGAVKWVIHVRVQPAEDCQRPSSASGRSGRTRSGQVVAALSLTAKCTDITSRELEVALRRQAQALSTRLRTARLAPAGR